MSQEIFLTLIIGLMTVVTFAIRLLPLHMKPERTPRIISAVIEYIPVAVIASITIPALFVSGDKTFTWLNPEIIAAVPVIIISFATRNLILSVVAGVTAHILVSHFLF